MIVLFMLGVLACLLFLCVSPMIGLLASHKADNTPSLKPRPIQKQSVRKQSIQKQTFSAR